MGKHTNLEPERCDHVIIVAKSVGYKHLINDAWSFGHPECRSEYECVSDADLLDAIGAVGIGRCFAFSGKKNRNLFRCDATQTVADKIDVDEYSNRDSRHQQGASLSVGSSVSHFFEKLFRITALLQTEEGRRLGGE